MFQELQDHALGILKIETLEIGTFFKKERQTICTSNQMTMGSESANPNNFQKLILKNSIRIEFMYVHNKYL